jgi:hypothetical protein
MGVSNAAVKEKTNTPQGGISTITKIPFKNKK